MMVFSEIFRAARRHSGSAALWAGLAGLTLWVALGLAGCGGGTSQVVAFKPARLIVFGDEMSLLVNDGANNAKKFTVNGLNAASQRDCLLLPIWVQALSTGYNFAFAECNTAAVTPTAFMRAKRGAKVEGAASGIAAQLAEQAATGQAIKPGDLVTVMLGANDLIELADRLQAGTLTSAEAVVEARRRGAVLAEHVNAMLALGPRAIVSTVPDMGVSPYALALDRASPGAAARLSMLGLEFNAALRISIDSTRFDGRNYGLVLADDLVQSMARNPAAYSLNNVIDAVCVKPLPDCTSAAADIVSGATATGYLWADERRMAPAAHLRLGAQALSRAQNNPF